MRTFVNIITLLILVECADAFTNDASASATVTCFTASSTPSPYFGPNPNIGCELIWSASPSNLLDVGWVIDWGCSYASSGCGNVISPPQFQAAWDGIYFSGFFKKFVQYNCVQGLVGNAVSVALWTNEASAPSFYESVDGVAGFIGILVGPDCPGYSIP